MPHPVSILAHIYDSIYRYIRPSSYELTYTSISQATSPNTRTDGLDTHTRDGSLLIYLE